MVKVLAGSLFDRLTQPAHDVGNDVGQRHNKGMAHCSNMLFLYSFLMVPSVCSFGFRHLPWCSLAQFQSQYLHVARLRLRFYDVLREWFCGYETRDNLNSGKEDCLVVSCMCVAPMCNSLFMFVMLALNVIETHPLKLLQYVSI